MKIISIPRASRHILLPFTNFALDKDDAEFWKYEFGYINLTANDLKKIRQLTNEKTFLPEGILQGLIRLTHPLRLLQTDVIYDSVLDEMPGFEHIKLDNINFLSGSPKFDHVNPVEACAYLKRYRNEFMIEAERVPNGYGYPTIIYRSPWIPLVRINQLLTEMAIPDDESQ